MTERKRVLVGYDECRCILTQYCDGECRPVFADRALRNAARATPADHSVPMAIPEGWQLVPFDPTDQMTFAGQAHRYESSWSMGAIWQEMLDAAPQAPQPEAQSVTRDAMQGKVIACGFKYWRASDAHGVVGTVKQAEDFIADLVGVEVEIKK